MKPDKIIDQYVSSWVTGAIFILLLVLSAIMSEILLRSVKINNFFAFAVLTIFLTALLNELFESFIKKLAKKKQLGDNSDMD